MIGRKDFVDFHHHLWLGWPRLDLLSKLLCESIVDNAPEVFRRGCPADRALPVSLKSLLNAVIAEGMLAGKLAWLVHISEADGAFRIDL